MSSNPSPNATPPPGGGGGAAVGPSPHMIGSRFAKAYYQTLITTPSQLNRFYQPDSTVTRGMEPSSPATPSELSLATTNGTSGQEGDVDGCGPGERVRKAFFDWAGGVQDNGDDVLRIDFERGAIDAQESICGGILLVVTGHMFLPGLSSKEKAFVHTFFLNNNAGPGKKKQFQVKNDILRFLEPVVAPDEEEEGLVAEEEQTEVLSPPVSDEPVAAVEPTPALLQEPVVPLVPVEYEPSAEEEKEDVDEIERQPMIIEHTIVDVEPAAEEEKIDVMDTSSAGSDSSPASSPASDGKKKKHRKKRGGKSRSRSNSPRKDDEDNKETDTPEKPKTPGSWASLVASSSGPPKGSQDGGKKGRRGSPKSSRGDKSSSSNQGGSPSKAPPQSSKEATSSPEIGRAHV